MSVFFLLNGEELESVLVSSLINRNHTNYCALSVAPRVASGFDATIQPNRHPPGRQVLLVPEPTVGHRGNRLAGSSWLMEGLE